MSKNNLELTSSADGATLFLTFWDSMHGADVLLEIESSGDVYEVNFDENPADPDNIDAMIERREKVDLIDKLHQIAMYLEETS